MDDLVTKGTDEPYRMFTSRAEYRLHLRQDNADERMLPHARELGLLSPEDLQWLERRARRTDELEARLRREKHHGVTLADLLVRPEATLATWLDRFTFIGVYSPEEREKVEVRLKYRGYLKREKNRIRRFRDLEDMGIPGRLDFQQIRGISTEGREKLTRIRPETIGQASRISGVSPADVSVLLVALRKRAG